MLALEPIITARAQAALGAGWRCIGFTDAGERKTYPQASIMFATAQVVDSKTGAVNLQPAWQITLAVRRGVTAAGLLDTAIAALIGHLHNWPPGQAGGRAWNHLALLQAGAPQYLDDGLVGVELIFTTHARYDGQP